MWFIDDYGAVDVAYVVHAAPVDPCPEHPVERYAIGLILHVTVQSYMCAIYYPTRQLRDASFEGLVAVMRRQAFMESLVDEEDDDEDSD